MRGRLCVSDSVMSGEDASSLDWATLLRLRKALGSTFSFSRTTISSSSSEMIVVDGRFERCAGAETIADAPSTGVRLALCGGRFCERRFTRSEIVVKLEAAELDAEIMVDMEDSEAWDALPLQRESRLVSVMRRSTSVRRVEDGIGRSAWVELEEEDWFSRE